MAITLRGNEERKTKLVCGYNICYNKKPVSNTSYQQHRRYFINHGQDIYPRAKFREDFEEQLVQWRTEWFKLIVCLNDNEHIYKEQLGNMLTDCEVLCMVEVVSESTGHPIGTHFLSRDTND